MKVFFDTNVYVAETLLVAAAGAEGVTKESLC